MENKNIDTGTKNNDSEKSNFFWTVVLIVVFSSIFGGFIGFISGGAAGIFFSGEKVQNIEKKKEADVVRLSVREESEVIDVVEAATPAVVSILISRDVPKYKSFFNDPFLGGGEPETERQQIGGGSGFIVSSKGFIVTNKHVVNDESAEYTVITNDGKEYGAVVLAKHPSMDIAIMKIEGEDFPVLELGDSDSLKVGQSAIAIGNSLGEFSNSVSLGIVSGLGRNIIAGSILGGSERLNDIIQTDAAINPGNSGGPLLDLGGKVIGVNVAVARGAENVGFALPINEVKNTIEQVESTGKISIPFLGVRYVILNEDMRQETGLEFDYGALILRGERMTDFAVIPGSPADKASVVENDIILEVNGEKINENNSLGDILSEYMAGDEIKLKVWHRGEIKEVPVTLEERNSNR